MMNVDELSQYLRTNTNCMFNSWSNDALCLFCLNNEISRRGCSENGNILILSSATKSRNNIQEIILIHRNVLKLQLKNPLEK